MVKPIKAKAPLEQAIETLQDAVDTLDDMIKSMQNSQATLRSWLEPGKEIGWVDGVQDEN
jgi:prefoldin subunit 5